MTLWQSGGLVFGYAVYAVAWLWGGRPERFAAGVLLVFGLLTDPANGWSLGAYRPGFMAMDSAVFLALGWLAFRSDRWWVLVAAAGSALIFLAVVLRLLNPGLSHDAMVSAKIGLAYVIDLALLLGVWERWLAGEPPAAGAAWARATQVTQARKAGTHTSHRRGRSQT